MKIAIVARFSFHVLFEHDAKENSIATTLKKAIEAKIDLRGADLTGADLTGADLRGADLRGVYLTGADLRGVYLTGADLRGVYLTGALMAPLSLVR